MDASSPPTHHVHYNGRRALFSNRYIRHFYTHEGSYIAPSRKVDERLIQKLIDFDIDSINHRRRFTLIILLLLVIYAITISRLTSDRPGAIAAISGNIILLGIEYFLLAWLRRWRPEERAADQLFFAILVLDTHAPLWHKTSFRWEYAARLERLAKSIEYIPLGLKKVAPTVRKECLRLSGTKAQAIRNLELSIIKSGTATTCEETATQLADGLHLVIEGRWYDLPEAPHERQTSRLRLVMQIAGAIVAFAGAVTIIGLTSKLGPEAPILATTLIAIAIAFLNLSGAPAEVVGKYTQAASDLVHKE